ncbi:D-tagatose-bisphosphate aldolase, class II, non-catalytic subunit [Chitiniphilus eburneus]|uniref:D-tagatose-bisphosphate aldolase, class II, non-catalytic subunit n=1 Tax=Chitiniphilus eburneus TaxID=2571148 RepID=A0A4U0PPA5_9NEIS|nr:D-tagatose-bisphosphate aldolase, class II, non-catalytic subunit [Chitiniphilus eburneus]TJZ70086.1 D-tagatose-bisphosphate aldolase, class II, non-catalytic subunit [Chitiniphilus eburneus]
MSLLLDIIRHHKAGHASGIYSVCSAHPLVLEAAMRQGLEDDSPVLIEATSNQVNQFGGYTGMRPADFRDFVLDLAQKIGFDPERLILGGDHLGPNVWKKAPAAEAMKLAGDMVREYVQAGFRKIHLDCSMSCAGDPVPLSDAVVAERAAQLCGICEATWREVGGDAPVYVIGTEVPVPGGANEELGELEVTSPQAAGQTLQVHRDVFAAAGLADAFERAIAMVVQPGVEFDHHKVVAYQPAKAAALSAFIVGEPLVYEAHSTDYQSETALTELVRDHFAILKVGPGLTFAMREALYALDQIERETIGEFGASHLKDTITQVMQEEPDYWLPYYSQPGHQQYLDRNYSFSDRIRYYWPHPKVVAAQQTLFANLARQPLLMTLVSQYLPEQARKVAEARLPASAEALVIDKVMEVTRSYARACGMARIEAARERRVA